MARLALLAEFAEFPQSVCTNTSWPIFDHGKQLLDLSEMEEHLLMANIRNIITAYRLRSAAHFDITINVKQAFRTEDIRLTRNSRLNVLFLGFLETNSYVCRPVFRKHPHKKARVATQKVQIFDSESGGFVALNTFLTNKYPSYPESVGYGEMRNWWAANGKVFKWMDLPTELKEQVILYCVDQPPVARSDYQCNNKRYNYRFGGRYEPGVYEIVDKLTHWASLLGVSHQVRAITLRLCLMGNSEMIIPGGFSIVSGSCCGLDTVLQRLGRHYQMAESNSLPTNYTTQALADCYKQYPRIYPDLTQYATFRHGIRQLYLHMNFLNYMHFFKVTTGDFACYLRPGAISHEVFEQLPHLNEIALRLPCRPRQGWLDDPWQNGPKLFHYEFPCARILHRVIYERVAEILTLYPNVEVKGFVDDYEKDRFYALRKSNMESSKWTAAEYEELYTECGGGIELEETVQPGSWLEVAEDDEEEDEAGYTVNTEREVPQVTANAFFPPKCHCEEKCHLTFLEVEKKRKR
jgi:hypothetical protein